MNDTQTAPSEKNIKNLIIGKLWDEWTDTLIGNEPPEEKEAIAIFAEQTGCTITSPFAMLYRGFRAGVVKVMELYERTAAQA